MDLNRKSMPAPKFAHSTRNKTQIAGENEAETDESEGLSGLRYEQLGELRLQNANNQKQTSKSVELAELSQFQSVLKRHDPAKSPRDIQGNKLNVVNKEGSSRHQVSETSQSLPDSLSELKIRHHEKTKLVPSSGAVDVGSSSGVGSNGMQNGGGFRSGTPISGVNNMAAVRLPSLQKQPISNANKVNQVQNRVDIACLV